MKCGKCRKSQCKKNATSVTIACQHSKCRFCCTMKKCPKKCDADKGSCVKTEQECAGKITGKCSCSSCFCCVAGECTHTHMCSLSFSPPSGITFVKIFSIFLKMWEKMSSCHHFPLRLFLNTHLSPLNSDAMLMNK